MADETKKTPPQLVEKQKETWHSTEWSVEVTVHQAEKLRDADFVGKSDPFVTLSFDGQDKQQTAHKDDTCDPVFDETFTLQHNKDTDLILYFSVCDFDDVSSNDPLGFAQIDLSTVEASDKVWLDCTLEDKPAGRLQISVKFPSKTVVPEAGAEKQTTVEAEAEVEGEPTVDEEDDYDDYDDDFAEESAAVIEEESAVEEKPAATQEVSEPITESQSAVVAEEDPEPVDTPEPEQDLSDDDFVKVAVVEQQPTTTTTTTTQPEPEPQPQQDEEPQPQVQEQPERFTPVPDSAASNATTAALEQKVAEAEKENANIKAELERVQADHAAQMSKMKASNKDLRNKLKQFSFMLDKSLADKKAHKSPNGKRAAKRQDLPESSQLRVKEQEVTNARKRMDIQRREIVNLRKQLQNTTIDSVNNLENQLASKDQEVVRLSAEIRLMKKLHRDMEKDLTRQRDASNPRLKQQKEDELIVLKETVRKLQAERKSNDKLVKQHHQKAADLQVKYRKLKDKYERVSGRSPIKRSKSSPKPKPAPAAAEPDEASYADDFE